MPEDVPRQRDRRFLSTALSRDRLGGDMCRLECDRSHALRPPQAALLPTGSEKRCEMEGGNSGCVRAQTGRERRRLDSIRPADCCPAHSRKGCAHPEVRKRLDFLEVVEGRAVVQLVEDDDLRWCSLVKHSAVPLNRPSSWA